MRTLLNPSCSNEILARLSSISVHDRPKWGTMSAHQMITHLSRQLKCAMGLVKDKPVHTIWRFWPLNKLVIYILPWPHGLPTAKEWKDPERNDWNEDVKQLRKHIRAFLEKNSNEEWGDHPILGKLNKRDWGKLSYRHIDHHFRQFGQ